MIKKLFFAGALTIALATLALAAEPASADYYVCNGNLRSGDPAPSECHYYLAPQRTNAVTQDRARNRANVVNSTTSNSSRHRANIVNSSTSSNSSSGRRRANVVNNSGYSRTTPDTNFNNRKRVNIITEIGRNYSDLKHYRDQNANNGIIVNDPDNYSKKYEVRNARKYCIREYCYIIYDYCYDLSHCEQKIQKVHNDEYNDNWRDFFEDYLDGYINRHRECNNYGTGRCIYRGFYFGGFHNGYWHY